MPGPTAELVDKLRILLQKPTMTLKTGKQVSLCLHFMSHTDAACAILKIDKDSLAVWSRNAYKGDFYKAVHDLLCEWKQVSTLLLSLMPQQHVAFPGVYPNAYPVQYPQAAQGSGDGVTAALHPHQTEALDHGGFVDAQALSPSFPPPDNSSSGINSGNINEAMLGPTPSSAADEDLGDLLHSHDDLDFGDFFDAQALSLSFTPPENSSSGSNSGTINSDFGGFQDARSAAASGSEFIEDATSAIPTAAVFDVLTLAFRACALGHLHAAKHAPNQ
jgi:hypothetical protein